MPNPEYLIPDTEKQPKVAIVHDWLARRGGAEKVLLDIHEIWPEAPIYTAIYNPQNFPEFANATVHTTWLNKIKLAQTKHQLFSIPRAWAYHGIDLSEYDIVISNCSAESKYVKTGPNTLHICYCYTPIRYYWSDYDWYRKHPPFSGWLATLSKLILPLVIGPLRRFDYKRAQQVDLYVTQSKYIQHRIKKYYDRDSTVIHPGITTSDYTGLTKHNSGAYVVVGRQVSYKRLDLAIDAFNELGLPLLVAGTGEEVAKQKLRAKDNIKFLGFVPDAELFQLLADAKALIWPQEEDYGLVPIEAQAAGTPVIAYAAGGTLETVVDGTTGIFFDHQTKDDLINAIKHFETLSFDPQKARAQAAKFDESVFKRELKAYVDNAYAEFKAKRKKYT